ncbi:hypothetical protein AAIB25_06170 [Neisseria gonorrhoeae]
MPSETIFRRHFSLILLGEWLTLNVSTFIIQFIGASVPIREKPHRSGACTGSRKMKLILQILILVLILMLAGDTPISG